MSGHSKWSTIKRKKGALDAKRGKIFSKLIKEITVASRIGGGDEDANPRLRLALIKARASNMPSANIERAIAKGTGEADGVHYEEITYEGYGPGGVAFIVECMTDNRNRTVGEVRHAFSRNNGNMAENGAVSWNFERVGFVSVAKGATSEDDLMMMVMDAGAESIEDGEDVWEIYSAVDAMEAVRQAVLDQRLEVKEYSPTLKAKTLCKVEAEDARRIMKLIDALEDLDDVQEVTTNFDADEAVMAGLE
ncbi:MAG: YebC/PmpR family DNA-binding transcriptional regulator [bacterium]|jgi:YebC/PmpR family DNA-binding regulatory protein|nr:YebC/PmpR family DNA-binding transcriptional regulator [bacterium]